MTKKAAIRFIERKGYRVFEVNNNGGISYYATDMPIIDNPTIIDIMNAATLKAPNVTRIAKMVSSELLFFKIAL